MLKFLRRISGGVLVRRSSTALDCCRPRARCFADTTAPTSSSKQLVVAGNESEHRVRVRRARPADGPRLLRFVREHPRAAWPSLFASALTPSAASQLVLSDYVSRFLAQGHSMVAEQIGSRRGWITVRGLALGGAVCAWDAALLERWADCLRCARSKRFVHFIAHCLRAPQLHHKYRVRKILQVILILPPESLKDTEIVQMLARSAVQRGREVGFPLLRFDVTNEIVAKALEDLNFKKEWYLSYDVVPETLTETKSLPANDSLMPGNFVAVYSVFTALEPETKASSPTDPPRNSSVEPTANTKSNPDNVTADPAASPTPKSTAVAIVNATTKPTGDALVTSGENFTVNLKTNVLDDATSNLTNNQEVNAATNTTPDVKIDSAADVKANTTANVKTNSASDIKAHTNADSKANTTVNFKTNRNENVRFINAETDLNTKAMTTPKAKPVIDPAANPKTKKPINSMKDPTPTSNAPPTVTVK